MPKVYRKPECFHVLMDIDYWPIDVAFFAGLSRRRHYDAAIHFHFGISPR